MIDRYTREQVGRKLLIAITVAAKPAQSSFHIAYSPCRGGTEGNFRWLPCYLSKTTRGRVMRKSACSLNPRLIIQFTSALLLRAVSKARANTQRRPYGFHPLQRGAKFLIEKKGRSLREKNPSFIYFFWNLFLFHIIPSIFVRVSKFFLSREFLLFSSFYQSRTKCKDFESDILAKQCKVC